MPIIALTPGEEARTADKLVNYIPDINDFELIKSSYIINATAQPIIAIKFTGFNNYIS